MQAKRVPYEQQLQLIMECRKSSLSDYQWCLEHDINPGTFYNWVSRHRKKACVDNPIPEVPQSDPAPALQQEVVRLDPRQFTEELPEEMPEQSPVCMPLPAAVTPELPCISGHAMEIVLNGAILRISNDISPGLLSQTLRILKGISC